MSDSEKLTEINRENAEESCHTLEFYGEGKSPAHHSVAYRYCGSSSSLACWKDGDKSHPLQ